MPRQASGKSRSRKAERRPGSRIAPEPDPPRSCCNPRHALWCPSADAPNIRAGCRAKQECRPAAPKTAGCDSRREPPARIGGSVIRRQSPPGNPGVRDQAARIVDRGGARNCAIALRAHRLCGSARACRGRGRRSIPARPLQLPSVQPADLPDTPCAAVAASHGRDRGADACLLAVPRDKGRDRDVAGMAAAARNPEPAAAETAQSPPFEAQLRILPRGDPGQADSGRAVIEGSLAGRFRGLVRGRARTPELVRREPA